MKSVVFISVVFISVVSLEVEVFASVEIDQRVLVEILITGLDQVGFGFQIVVLRLVELGDGSLALLIHQSQP